MGLLLRLLAGLLALGQSVGLLGTTLPAPGSGGGGGTGTLIQSTNMVFVGAFRLPSGTVGNGDWGYGGYGLEYDASAGTYGGLISANNSRRLGEIYVPNPATWSTSSTVSALPQTTMAQNIGVPDDDDYANDAALYQNAGTTSLTHGDCKLWAGTLYCTDFVAYDGGNAIVGGQNCQSYAIFSRNTTFATTGSFLGWARINNGLPSTMDVCSNDPGFASQHPVSGYLAPVPAVYQASLGKMLVGAGGGNIISLTSLGPSAFFFDPTTYSAGGILTSATTLWYQTGTHETIGKWDPRPCSGATCGTYPSDKSYDWTGNAQATAAAIPTNWRSLLVLGRGAATFCYGQGTQTAALDGTPVGDGDTYCYDPWDSTKGTHSDARTAHVWAYDLNDLIAVKTGANPNPYTVVPYAHWALTLPTGWGTCGPGESDNQPLGAALGTIAGTEYLFVSFYQADHSDLSCRPLIGIYKFQ